MEIQATLADIPRRLNNIQRISQAHRKTPELHLRADQVFLSIFVILERIVNKLSMGFVGKCLALSASRQSLAVLTPCRKGNDQVKRTRW